MRKLASHIKKELKAAKQCGVYEPALSRVWPSNKGREGKIAAFAKKRGWRLRFYRDGFCAIFDKERRRRMVKTKA
jgi:hypothetical protein